MGDFAKLISCAEEFSSGVRRNRGLDQKLLTGFMNSIMTSRGESG